MPTTTQAAADDFAATIRERHEPCLALTREINEDIRSLQDMAGKVMELAKQAASLNHAGREVADDIAERIVDAIDLELGGGLLRAFVREAMAPQAVRAAA